MTFVISHASADGLDPKMKELLVKVVEYDNIPRKEKKFKNFLYNSFGRITYKSSLIEQSWTHLNQEFSKIETERKEKLEKEEEKKKLKEKKETKIDEKAEKKKRKRKKEKERRKKKAKKKSKITSKDEDK